MNLTKVKLEKYLIKGIKEENLTRLVTVTLKRIISVQNEINELKLERNHVP